MNEALEYLMTQKRRVPFRQLFQMKIPTAEAFSIRLLEAVARNGTESTLSVLLDSGIDRSNLSGTRGGRLLHAAAYRTDIGVAKTLVKCGACVNFKDPGSQFTPLSSAVYDSNDDLVRLLLDAGAQVSGPSNADALYTALRLESPRTIDLLLKAGANVDDYTFDLRVLDHAYLYHGMNIYHMLLPYSQAEKTSGTISGVLSASQHGIPSLQQYLERRGYSGSFNDREVLKSALRLAILRNGHLTEIESLLGFRVELPRLYSAVRSCEIDKVKLLLGKGAKITTEAVNEAARWKRWVHILDFLFENGADIKLVGPEALSTAIQYRNLQAVELLIRHKVNLRQPDDHGFFPTQMAAKQGNLDFLKCIVRAGGDVNAPPRMKNHFTALHYAAKSGDLQCVRFLLGAEAEIDQLQECHGMTLLEACLYTRRYEAATSRLAPERVEVFGLLLDSGAAINGPNLRTRCRRWNSTLTWLVLRAAGEDLIRKALNAGADINQPGHGKWARTPIQAAAEVGNLDVVKELLMLGADINAPAADELGRTALQAACSSEAPTMELIRFLLNNGAEVNAVAGRDGGLTALQGAAIQGHHKIVLLLLEIGAEVNADPAIENGRMALDGAAEYGAFGRGAATS